MAQFDYLRMQATGDALLKQFGMAASLRRAGVDRPCVVAVIEYMPKDQASVLANPVDRTVLMSAATPEVQATPPDSEQDQLVTYVQPPASPPVVNEILPMTAKPKLFAPAGIPVLWQFTVRR